jgi:hypothetical protein
MYIKKLNRKTRTLTLNNGSKVRYYINFLVLTPGGNYEPTRGIAVDLREQLLNYEMMAGVGAFDKQPIKATEQTI